MSTHEELFSKYMTASHIDGFQHDLYIDLTQAIRDGNAALIEAFPWEKCMDMSIGKMSDDPMQQAKFLAGWIAIDEKVDAEMALSLTDYYVHYADSLTDIRKINLVNRDMLAHFCRIIKRQKTIPYSATTKRIIEYINNNVYSMIYVSDIVKHMNLSASYISQYFKKETGESLKRYIHSVKIREARNLMRYTSMSITDIAAQLCYTDLSHFTRICKDQTGRTPRQLLMELRQEV